MLSAFLKILALTPCPLLLALCLFSVPACKKPTEPKAALPDTTSHDFVFELDTLGNGSSSVLNDVWIFDENNFWAVGEIYVQDSSGQAETTYNVARWDGKKWNLMQLYYPFNQTQLLIVPIRGIFAFGPNDIWLAAGSVFRWNGSSIQPFLLRPMILSGPETVEKLWGVSSSNLYGVGNAGTIVHYDGSTWQKLASGTTVDIQDIWGAVDEKTGEQTVLAVASLVNYGRGLDLIEIKGTTVTKLDTMGLRVAESSIWFVPDEVYYVAGDGLFQKFRLEEQRWQFNDFQPSIYIDCIRANAPNDIFVCGSFGFLAHYNGSTWKDYTGLEVPRFFSRYKGASVKQDLVVAVGWLNDQAVIVRGTRR